MSAVPREGRAGGNWKVLPGYEGRGWPGSSSKNHWLRARLLGGGAVRAQLRMLLRMRPARAGTPAAVLWKHPVACPASDDDRFGFLLGTLGANQTSPMVSARTCTGTFIHLEARYWNSAAFIGADYGVTERETPGSPASPPRSHD